MPKARPLDPLGAQELGDLLDIRTLPTFLLLRDGVEASRLEGVPQQRPARALAQAIRQHLLGQPGESAAGGVVAAAAARAAGRGGGKQPGMR